MYRVFFKMGMLLVLMLGGMSYMFVIKTGRSPLEMLNLEALGGNKTSVVSVDRPETLLNPETKGGVFNSKGDKTKVYKWVDENGTVHFTNVPPVEDVGVETLTVDPNMNSMAGIKPQPKKDESKSATSATDISYDAYSPQGIKDMMDKAKGVQDLLDKRAESQKKALEGAQ